MNKDLEKKLIEEFPTFFKNIYGHPSKTCMAFGLDCGEGWYDLIYETCKKIKELDRDNTFVFLQIKEKFGGLRLYCSGGNKEIGVIISKAEDESYKICEYCGTKENITTEGRWILTLCKDCRNKRDSE